MELSERIENLGGGGSAAYAGLGGGIGLFMLAIFLVILFAAFRQHHGGDMASVANAMGEFHPRENCADKLTWARYANYMDPEVARNHTEIVRQAGEFARQQAVDTGEIKGEVQRQTHELVLGQERNTWAILNNQNEIARNQERMFYQAREADATRREAEQRERAIMLENKLLASEQAREADRRQAETVALINGQFCNVNARISNVECNMPRMAPCYVPSQPVATFVCGPRPANGCCNG